MRHSVFLHGYHPVFLHGYPLRVLTRVPTPCFYTGTTPWDLTLRIVPEARHFVPNSNDTDTPTSRDPERRIGANAPAPLVDPHAAAVATSGIGRNAQYLVPPTPCGGLLVRRGGTRVHNGGAGGLELPTFLSAHARSSSVNASARQPMCRALCVPRTCARAHCLPSRWWVRCLPPIEGWDRGRCGVRCTSRSRPGSRPRGSSRSRCWWAPNRR